MELTWIDFFASRDISDDISGWVLSGPHKSSKIEQINKDGRLGKYS